MKPDDALARLAEYHGVFSEFTDMQGVVHPAGPETRRALLRANGLEIASEADVLAHVRDFEARRDNSYVADEIVVAAARRHSLGLAAPARWQVLSEDGGDVIAEGQDEARLELPPLPAGVHDLCLSGGKGVQQALLIAAPPAVPDLESATGCKKIWGVMAAFYGLATAPPKTLADFSDLQDLAKSMGHHGAGFLGINPVHALGDAAEQTISPYSPTHRGFLNSDHIAVARAQDVADTSPLLDYSAHRKAHRPALEAAFSDFKSNAGSARRDAFDAFCTAGGAPLRDFARFEALSLRHGADSRRWPATAGKDALDPVLLEFAMWKQWQADIQLNAAQRAARAAGMPIGLYLDLAVGARLGGAESWGAGAATATGVSLGAPPDHLSPAGQNWQLSALSPRRLRAGRYEAFRFILRQNMRHCGLLRIDHALGLNRSFWLPEDGAPGGYIRQPFQSLMAIIAIEAQRSGTVIVGEDLGLVPKGFREEMAAHGLYGYSVLQYEKDRRGALLPASRLRPQSLACFGTHDTPTLEGFWQGRDIGWWEKLGWISTDEAAKAVGRRQSEKRQLAGIDAPAPLPQRAGAGLRDSVHASLAASPAALVAVQLDDILCVEEAQNLPGTVDEHPNWRRVYPNTIDQIDASADLKKTAGIMRKAGRSVTKRKETT